MHYRRVFNFSYDKSIENINDIDFSYNNICKKIKDCDVIVLKDISELYFQDISDYALAGVEDVNNFALARNIELDLSKTTYINAGVLLLNLEELKKNKYMELIKH